ncbi:hypothetical protein V8E36_002067 [Tilletia maclaganii]
MHICMGAQSAKTDCEHDAGGARREVRGHGQVRDPCSTRSHVADFCWAVPRPLTTDCHILYIVAATATASWQPSCRESNTCCCKNERHTNEELGAGLGPKRKHEHACMLRAASDGDLAHPPLDLCLAFQIPAPRRSMSGRGMLSACCAWLCMSACCCGIHGGALGEQCRLSSRVATFACWGRGVSPPRSTTLAASYTRTQTYSALHKSWDEVKKGTPKVEACREKRHALQKQAVKTEI